MKKEVIFIIIAALCVIAVALFMIGGYIQDIDYHDLSDLPLTEQHAAYERMQTRVAVGHAIQLVSAIGALVGFVMMTVISLTVGSYNAAEAEKKYIKQQ